MTSPEMSHGGSAADDAVLPASIAAEYDDEETILASESNSTTVSGRRKKADAGCRDDAMDTADACAASTSTGDETFPSSSRSGRTLRRCRQDSETVCCPVCKLPLHSVDLKTHIEIELERLSKISSVCRYRRSVTIGQASPRKKAFLRIQKNRQARLRARMRRGEAVVDYTSCPICSELINGTPEELNEHVELCLNKVQRTDEDQDVHVDDSDGDEDENFEEYEWAGQTRVRASSMLQRDPTAATVSTMPSDEAVDLDIEDDDCTTYGQAQYLEADLLLLGSDEPGDDKNRRMLRNAVLGGEGSARCSSTTANGKWNRTTSDADSQDTSSTVSQASTISQPSSVSTGLSDDVALATCSAGNARLGNGGNITPVLQLSFSPPTAALVHSLQTKVVELERQLRSSDIPRCLICMEAYAKPLTSIQCWHVHCEECWLRTLGAKKLCPQCNVITSPAQLRRVYI